jgi:hypothetical protein
VGDIMENISFLTRKKLTMDKFSSRVKVTTENPIKKILSLEASSIISSCEQLNGNISFSGKIKVNAVFVVSLSVHIVAAFAAVAAAVEHSA